MNRTRNARAMRAPNATDGGTEEHTTAAAAATSDPTARDHHTAHTAT